MIGFGRAVGETMIVLMATGNTPLMDWSIFNGIRTLSANIAVEIPEAPLRRHALPDAVPLGRAAVRHDLRRQHRRRTHSAAAARTVQGGVMASLRTLLRRGDPAIWLSGSGLGICLLMIGGMIGLILVERPRVLLAAAGRAGHAEGRHRAAGRNRRPRADSGARHAGAPRDASASSSSWATAISPARTSGGSTSPTIASTRLPGRCALRRAARVRAVHRLGGAADGRGARGRGRRRRASAGALGPLVEQAARDRAAIRALERGQIARGQCRIERERLRLRARLDLTARPAARPSSAARRSGADTERTLRAEGAATASSSFSWRSRRTDGVAAAGRRCRRPTATEKTCR